MKNYTTIKLTKENQIAEVAFNQPEKANALGQKAWDELGIVMEILDKEEDVRAIILTGEGKHFCAGIDLKFLGAIQAQAQDECPAKSGEKIRENILFLQAPINKIASCRKPVIAAVQGACVGAGLDIVAACDMRFCSAEAYLAVKEIDMAMVADLGSLQRLSHLMPEGLVREMAYTGRTMSAEEAHTCGLVNQVFEDKTKMLEAAKKIAQVIALKSPLAISGTKKVLNYSQDHTVAEGLEYVATWNAAMLLSKDLKEAMRAYTEKRPPSYR